MADREFVRHCQHSPGQELSLGWFLISGAGPLLTLLSPMPLCCQFLHSRFVARSIFTFFPREDCQAQHLRDSEGRAFYGRLKYRYEGKHSEGNVFISNGDL